MARTSVLALMLILLLAGRARAIEIYADGQKYDSFAAYAASERAADKSSAAAAVPAVLNSQEADYVSQQARQMGIAVDLSKVRTLQIGPQDASARALHRLYVMSVEHGVADAIRDFYRAWIVTEGAPPRRGIDPRQLEQAIRQAVTSSKGPKLLIAEPGRIRIMDLPLQGGAR